MPSDLIAFEARRDELRRERRHHTPLEMPDEYLRLTTHIRQSVAACGEDHGRGVAQSFGAMFGWNPTDLLRGVSQA